MSGAHILATVISPIADQVGLVKAERYREKLVRGSCTSGTVLGASGNRGPYGEGKLDMRYFMDIFGKVYNALLGTGWVVTFIVMSGPLSAGQNAGTSNGGDFVGIWQYPGRHMPNEYIHYLKITNAVNGRFQLLEGVKDPQNRFKPKDTIMWTEPSPGCEIPAIYLAATKGRLKGQFVSDCFRPTHGIAMTYRLTLDLQSSEKLTYSVWSTQDGKHGDAETVQATRVNDPMPAKSGERQGQDGKLQIGLLKDKTPPGCGCYFGPVVPGNKKFLDKYLFISDDTGNAYINFDGRDTVLKEVGRRQPKGDYGYCDGNRDGKRCEYRAKGITATVAFLRKTRTDYEVRDYEVTITVENGGIKQQLKGTGSCGC